MSGAARGSGGAGWDSGACADIGARANIGTLGEDYTARVAAHRTRIDAPREAAVYARFRTTAADARLAPDAVEAVFRTIVGAKLRG